MRKPLMFLTVYLLCLAGPAAQSAREQTACIQCHANADFVGEEGARIVQQFSSDIHSERGLSCESCHGGNPDPALSDDPEASMDEKYSENPFVGIPARPTIPGFCGECHSDPDYMKRFKPDARVDQEREYWTSQHGEALRQGDIKVATCTDCHGIHGILQANNPRSSVYPVNVAQTCRHCHSDPERMTGYKAPDGSPLAVDQYARWRQSVHATALFDKEDLTAPTCNDCHGNHGAAPPGLQSIAFVCGQCHGRESELFRRSAKHDALQMHNDFLADSEGTCVPCHEDKPRAELPITTTFGECTSCHGNHGIVRPNVTMLSLHPETPCAFCHGLSEEVIAEFPGLGQSQERYEKQKALLVQQAKSEGMAEDELFDWLVDQALNLPNHVQSPAGSEAGQPTLRPGFQTLWEKFRIGKTFYTYADPVTGQLTRASVVRCTHCHADEDSAGTDLAKSYLEEMQQLTALTAAAERSLLSAHRAGIETRSASLDVNKAVDAEISLAVLLHTFSLEKGFSEKQSEGLGFARSALQAGKEAHSELQTRRLGLAVSLVFVLLLLIGLGFKIRQISRREEERARAR